MREAHLCQGCVRRFMPLPLSNPASAPPQMRGIVRGLAQQFPTAIISGRGREKVENFVQLKELYYAGSHGMAIAGPLVRGEGRGGSLRG